MLCAPQHIIRPRIPPPQANFFAQFFPPPAPNPADVFNPDPLSTSPGLPLSYKDIYDGAIDGVKAVLSDGRLEAVEVDFPPVANVNARGDGSAKSERLVAEANSNFARQLCSSLGANAVIVACSGDAARALGSDAITLRDGVDVAGCDVAICVAPCMDEQWEACMALSVTTVIVVNGLLQNGRLPHAYYYKPLTAFSVQTGGVVRRYPGAYECFDSSGARVDLEIPLARQGRRALPDTKDAQMLLQNRYGRGR